MNIYEKLQACRVELQEMNLKKSGKNDFAKFEYFELADFLPKVNMLFKTYKLFSVFSIADNLATLTIINSEDENGEKIVFTSPVEELELKGCNKIQALGGVHTYLKRYLYVNALEIVENDLFDKVSGKKEATGAKKPKEQEEEQAKTFCTLAQKDELKAILGGAEFAKLANKYGGKIPFEEFEKVKGAN